MITKTRIRAYRSDFNNQINMMVFQEHPSNPEVVYLAEPLRLKEHRISEAVDYPTFSVDHKDWQMLFDELWNIGMRPTDWEQKSVEREAQTKHIADLRQIAFKLLKI